MIKKAVSFLLVATVLISFSMLGSCSKKRRRFSDTCFDYFDTVTTVIGYESSKKDFDRTFEAVKAQLKTYHELYDIYNSYDGINNVCTVNSLVSGTYRKTTVDSRITDLLVYSKELYALTGGKTNVAMGSVLSLWHAARTNGIAHPENASLPDMKALKKAAEHTDINNMIINRENNTVFLSDPEMTLDVGAVAKGYAVQRIAEDLETQGISGYILNVGGNVKTIGRRPDGNGWLIGIENPIEDEKEPYAAHLTLDAQALVTSGSYQRYYTVSGKRYHHIIDPDTLMPSDRCISVSVVCENSALADGLSTALFSMPINDGRALIESLSGTEAMWISTEGKKYFSQGFEKYISD